MPTSPEPPPACDYYRASKRCSMPSCSECHPVLPDTRTEGTISRDGGATESPPPSGTGRSVVALRPPEIACPGSHKKVVLVDLSNSPLQEALTVFKEMPTWHWD